MAGMEAAKNGGDMQGAISMVSNKVGDMAPEGKMSKLNSVIGDAASGDIQGAVSAGV